MLGLILRILALIAFIVAAFAIRTGRVNAGWLGLALWVLAELLDGVAVDAD